MNRKPSMPAPAWSQRLLRWYQRCRRDLPWRGTRDPYAIWISEIMLQQTQVETAIPYYHRFLERFPEVGRLAAARLDSVLNVWQGLGYYRRARDLHRAARLVRREHAGRLPRSIEALCRLPGLGEYTAAAVASIAFDEAVPAIDGNVLRVICRMVAIPTPLRSVATRRRAVALLDPVLQRVRPSDFNQAMMELGALVCRPGQPLCAHCPVPPDCIACREAQTQAYPVVVARPPLPHERVVVALIRRADGRLLIARRPADRMFGGLWEFPGGKLRSGESLVAALHREMAEELGVRVHRLRRQPVVRQTYSHFRVTVTPFDCELLDGTPRPLAATALRWAAPSALNRYAFPLATRRIISRIASHGSTTPKNSSRGNG